MEERRKMTMLLTLLIAVIN